MSKGKRRSRQEEKAMFSRMGGKKEGHRRRGWFKDVPRAGLADLENAHEGRIPAGRLRDEARTNKRTISPFDPRTALWKENPGAWDVIGLDGPLPGQAPPSHPRPPPARPPPPAAPPPRKDAKPAPAKPAEAPAKKEGDEKAESAAAREVRSRMEKALPRAPSKRAPAISAAQEAELDRRLRRIILQSGKGQELEQGRKAEGYDPRRGGIVENAAGTMAFFVHGARARLKEKELPRMQAEFGPRIGNMPPIEDKLTDAWQGDLAAYLKAMNPDGEAESLPIGNSLFSVDYLRKLASAFKGPALLRTGKDVPLMIVQGKRGALLGPEVNYEGRSGVEQYLHNLKEQKGKEEAPRAPAPAAQHRTPAARSKTSRPPSRPPPPGRSPSAPPGRSAPRPASRPGKSPEAVKVRGRGGKPPQTAPRPVPGKRMQVKRAVPRRGGR